MNRTGYQVLGFVVWKGANLYLRRRYGGTPRKVALGVLVFGVLAALVFGGRRLGGDDSG